MKFLNKISNFFKKIGEKLLGKKKSSTKLIKMEDGSFKPERIATGNSNGILSIHERHLINGKNKKALKSIKKKRLANKARNLQHRLAA